MPWRSSGITCRGFGRQYRCTRASQSGMRNYGRRQAFGGNRKRERLNMVPESGPREVEKYLKGMRFKIPNSIHLRINCIVLYSELRGLWVTQALTYYISHITSKVLKLTHYVLRVNLYSLNLNPAPRDHPRDS